MNGHFGLKLTEDELIKAFEGKANYYCQQCNVKNTDCCQVCVFNYVKQILNIINRQKAEIERLKAEIKFSDYLEYETINQIKTEAYKEFAERLKELLGVTRFSVVDDLVKEMAGEK